MTFHPIIGTGFLPFGRCGKGCTGHHQQIDDMNGCWHMRPQKHARADEILGIHMHDSIVFIEKGKRERPYQVRVGK